MLRLLSPARDRKRAQDAAGQRTRQQHLFRCSLGSRIWSLDRQIDRGRTHVDERIRAGTRLHHVLRDMPQIQHVRSNDLLRAFVLGHVPIGAQEKEAPDVVRIRNVDRVVRDSDGPIQFGHKMLPHESRSPGYKISFLSHFS